VGEDWPGFWIRRYEDSDHDAVWTLDQLALEPVGAHRGFDGSDEDLHAIRAVYLDAGGEFVVGLLGQEIVAMGALRRAGPVRAEVKRMRVAPHRQGQGFGRQVLDHLEGRARELNLTQLHLTTTTRQLGAQALYRGGYRETGRGHEGPFDVIFFEKRLDP